MRFSRIRGRGGGGGAHRAWGQGARGGDGFFSITGVALGGEVHMAWGQGARSGWHLWFKISIFYVLDAIYGLE